MSNLLLPGHAAERMGMDRRAFLRAGLGVGGEWATGQTYVGETFPAPVRGRYGAFMQTGAPIGIAP